MSRTLAYKVEQWAIDMLALHADFPEGFQILHGDQDEHGDKTRVVVIAKTGEQAAEGCRPFAVEVSVQLRTSLRSVDEIETYNRAIEETFRTFPDVASKDAFSYLDPLAAGDDEKNTQPEQRQRGRVYNFLALEAA